MKTTPPLGMPARVLAGPNRGFILVAAFLMLVQGCAHFAHGGGWRLLFDGKTTAGWRGYGKPEFPKRGWVVEEGCLHLLPHPEQLDIITTAQFADFELEWEWRIAPKANNGLKYLVTEARPDAPGHEYQMVDETAERGAKHLTADRKSVV